MSFRSDRLLIVVYVLAIFASAALLFGIQPMFAKMILPLLGGSPSVWNTCVVFYEVALVLGYLYAHAIRRLSPRIQVAVHMAVVLAPLIVLPIGVPAGWHPPATAYPVGWLLGLLCVGVGLPYLAVSATGPLLQSWFSTTAHESAADPYFLYVASNAGSLAALIGYPLLVEPFVGLSYQSRFWSIGYVAFVVSIVLCGIAVAYRSRTATAASEPDRRAPPILSQTQDVDWMRRARWLVFAFVPSSLMLSVTTYLSSAIAPIPLLWVLPLSVYLITLILAFSRHPVSIAISTRASLWLLVPLVAIMTSQYPVPIEWAVALHVVAFFFIALVCHSRLAADRPHTERLTEFYLWLAVGGALGGIFNALIAPLVFKTVVEYPLVLVLACFLLRQKEGPKNLRRVVLDVVMPAVLFLVALLMVYVGQRVPTGTPAWYPTLAFAAGAGICVLIFEYPLRFALGIAALMLVSVPYSRSLEDRLFVDRDFFGIPTVLASGPYHVLIHSGTIHGAQNMSPSERDVPLTYYSRSGPLGDVFRALRPAVQHDPIALVGLGIGSATCYAQPSQRWTIYEIDPIVDRVAHDAALFTFLRDCVPSAQVILGDARLSLQNASHGSYGLMILDAYNSDYIPVHLITREAVALYLSRLSPDGVLAFHITNHNFDISPVLGNLAADAHLVCLMRQDDSISAQETGRGVLPSTWLVMARTRQSVSPLLADPRWRSVAPAPDRRLWTDDYSSLLTVIRL